LVAADPDVGVAAGSVAPDGLTGVLGQVLGRRYGNAVTVGDHHRVAADDGFHTAEEEVIIPAARGKA